MSDVKVAILMGSDSDLELMTGAAKVLEEFGVGYDIKVLSAHRSPALTSAYVGQAKENGISVIIAGAGGAAHLAGVCAAHTILPVIGVPINATPLNGMDSLLATVQMPSGIPVATVAVGKAGPKNAGLLAVQILAVSDSSLADKLQEYKKKLVEGVQAKNANLKVS